MLDVAHSRVLDKDEELGRRHSPFHPRVRTQHVPLLGPWRVRRRRLLVVIAILVGGFLLLQNLPALTTWSSSAPLHYPLEPSRTPPKNYAPNQRGRRTFSRPPEQEPEGRPPEIDDESGEKSLHYYDGPVRFYRLKSSLQAFIRTPDASVPSRSLLFAASSPRSMANLLPMACEMSRRRRASVHFAVMGRDTISRDDLFQLNGIAAEDCDLHFHDALPDYNEYSTEARASLAVDGAVQHIFQYTNLQAMIVDDDTVENAFFSSSVRTRMVGLGRPLIRIPAGGYTDFAWLTRLDASSLHNWYKPSIDIIIHVPPETSGGLLRLLKSLQAAYYHGLQVPRLTIDLAPNVPSFLQSFLRDFAWPPLEIAPQGSSSMLSLHHRIADEPLSSVQAAQRFAELFYPASNEHNHMLILSSQAEVSPQYLHYLRYTILDRYYSSNAMYQDPSLDDLMGLALDVPFLNLNKSTAFTTPTMSDMLYQKSSDDTVVDQQAAAPFLLQGSSSAAILFFGEKWVTFHDFLRRRGTMLRLGRSQQKHKVLADDEPAWFEHVLELMRLRGWTILHPNEPFVTVHNELSSIPEENMRGSGRHMGNQKHGDNATNADSVDAFSPGAGRIAKPVKHKERELKKSLPLHQILPFDGVLPKLYELPLLDSNGSLVSQQDLFFQMQEYVVEFRQTVGGCPADEAHEVRLASQLSTEDLFCIPDVTLS